jgi:heptose I phosphotransferase
VKSFAFEDWDAGRLTVNADYAPLLRRHGLTSFAALMDYRGGRDVKNVRPERTTVSLELADDEGRARRFYLKRHARRPLRELVKPLLRLTRPIWGARHEWQAILRFHEIGIATMTPVALGESAGRSLLLTVAIEGCAKLTDWPALSDPAAAGRKHEVDAAVEAVAEAARAMHGAGMHHQDFYLGHLMVPVEGPPRPVHVLDLGRVRSRRRLSGRWIVKDLAQLNYSARGLSASSRLRTLARYLGRPLQRSDRPLVRRIVGKSAAIARHADKRRAAA